MERKRILRKEMKEKLSGLSKDRKAKVERDLYRQLFQNSYWSDSKVIAVTVSQGFEWETKPIIEAGWKQGKKMVVPKCYPEESKLIFYHFENYQQLEIVYFNLLEPNPSLVSEVVASEIDLIIVPGLVFDLNHYRIGHGGGYYDRYLKNYSGKTISLAWKDQMVKSITPESFDVPIDQLIIY